MLWRTHISNYGTYALHHLFTKVSRKKNIQKHGDNMQRVVNNEFNMKKKKYVHRLFNTGAPYRFQSTSKIPIPKKQNKIIHPRNARKTHKLNEIKKSVSMEMKRRTILGQNGGKKKNLR